MFSSGQLDLLLTLIFVAGFPLILCCPAIQRTSLSILYECSLCFQFITQVIGVKSLFAISQNHRQLQQFADLSGQHYLKRIIWSVGCLIVSPTFWAVIKSCQCRSLLGYLLLDCTSVPHKWKIRHLHHDFRLGGQLWQRVLVVVTVKFRYLAAHQQPGLPDELQRPQPFNSKILFRGSDPQHGPNSVL